MSRSWTPKEMYLAEKALKKSWLDNRIYIVNPNTEEKKPLISDDEWEYIKSFPFLAHCGMDVIRMVYRKYKDKGTDVLTAVDKELRAVIEDDELPFLTARHHRSFNFSTRAWYEGTLDPSFYYSNHNDELFFTEISTIIEQTLGNFCEISDYVEEHQLIVDFVKKQVGIDLNRFRSGNGVNPSMTTYWDKNGPQIAVSWNDMSENEREKLKTLSNNNPRFSCETGSAWFAFIFLASE